jgi:glycosyltransferase involved in cell wall biosynthesis
MPPLVSIILCGHNQGEYLEEALRSALEQTYPHREVLAVDRGSNDGSLAILRRYEGDARVRVLAHGSDEGLNSCLNGAIRQARGEFVSLLWADDFYLPEKVERQVAAFAGLGQDFGVVYGPGYRLNAVTGERWLDPSATASGDLLPRLLRGGARINPIAPLVRQECFARHPFHEDLFGEWEAIFLRLAISYRFHYLGEPLVVMRDHDRNSGKATEGNVDRAMILLDRLLREPGFPPRLRPAVQAYRARILRRGAWRVARHGSDMAWARRAFRQSIRAQWQQAMHRKTLAGLALAHLPAGLRDPLNRLADGCRRQRVTTRHFAGELVALRDYERAVLPDSREQHRAA